MKVKEKNETRELVVDKASAKDVILNVTIGNSQIGGNVAFFKDLPDKIIGKGEFKNLNLGPASLLIDKKLVITTNILDSNDQTNGVIATYFFNLCNPTVTVIADKVDNDGDLFSFLIEFTFK
jgi:hypothetical protein